MLQVGGFAGWYRRRPFVGGLLVVLAGVEIFFSGQLDIGKIHVQVGIEGLQATILPIILVLVGLLAVFMPAHRIFYGVIALVVAVYSLVGVNLGGFFVGMLLGTVGGILTVSWLPKKPAVAGGQDAAGASENPVADSTADAPSSDDTARSDAVESAEPGTRPTGRRRRVARTGALVIGAALAGGCLAAVDLQGAPAANAVEPGGVRSGLCILGFIDCDPTPTPTPTPSAPATGPSVTPTPGAPGSTGGASGDATGGTPGGTSTSGGASTAPKQKAASDAGAPVFTQPSGDLSGTSIALGGLHYIGLVKVPISGSRTVTALKLGSDHLALRDFSLTTKAADGHGVKATAVTMSLDGDVVVYVDSVSAALGDGKPVKYDTTAPPTPGELLSGLVRLHLGLVGVTADSVSYAPSEQAVY